MSLMMVVAVADLAAPWPLKVVIDNVLQHRPLHGLAGGILGPSFADDRDLLLGVSVLALLAIVLFGALADYVSTAVLEGTGERFTAEIRQRLFTHLQLLSLSYHDRQRVGDLTTRITGDVSYVEDMLVASLAVLLPNVSMLIGIVSIMFVADPEFAALALGIAPVLFLAVYSYTRRIKRASKTARRKESEVASVASETLSSIRVVQAYTREQRHFLHFRDRNVERLGAGLEVVALQAKLSPVVDVLAAVGTALVLWFGARRVLHGEMSIGLLVVFLAYLSQLYKPMRNLSKLAYVTSRGQASADRIQEVLSVDARVPERPDARTAPPFRGDVSLRGVTFGYDRTPVLEDVWVEAKAGETVALAGPTGAGKSTLMSLIPRFYDPWRGQVLVDGQDVREFTLESLRSQVALVLQESILFHGTILENIAYGNEQATPDQIVAAAEAAYVDEFVRELPDGYETVVSERGTTLSGGQRQRIAIARALVRDAPIVILDEPTSGLDAVSERYVLKGLERLTRGRTVFVVAHRLSTLRSAQRIYVLEHGRIVDCGTHDELTERTGVYRSMHSVLVGAGAR
jgi:ATP-binding cassette subfamily B protein